MESAIVRIADIPMIKRLLLQPNRKTEERVPQLLQLTQRTQTGRLRPTRKEKKRRVRVKVKVKTNGRARGNMARILKVKRTFCANILKKDRNVQQEERHVRIPTIKISLRKVILRRQPIRQQEHSELLLQVWKWSI